MLVLKKNRCSAHSFHFEWLVNKLCVYPKNRIFVNIALAGRFRLQKWTVLWWFPFLFSCKPISNLKTSSRLGTHKYLDSASYLLKRWEKETISDDRIFPLKIYKQDTQSIWSKSLDNTTLVSELFTLLINYFNAAASISVHFPIFITMACQIYSLLAIGAPISIN